MKLYEDILYHSKEENVTLAILKFLRYEMMSFGCGSREMMFAKIFWSLLWFLNKTNIICLWNKLIRNKRVELENKYKILLVLRDKDHIYIVIFIKFWIEI